MRVAFPPRLLDRDSNGGSAVLHQLTTAGLAGRRHVGAVAHGRGNRASERAALANATHLKSAVQDFR